jgi:hypothetical protein
MHDDTSRFQVTQSVGGLTSAFQHADFRVGDRKQWRRTYIQALIPSAEPDDDA